MEEKIINQDIQEKVLKPFPGMGMLILTVLGFLAGICLCVFSILLFDGAVMGILLTVGIICVVVFPILMAGLKIVKPNEALVLTLFGKYYGTIKKDGFFFVNPFATGFNPSASGFMDELSADFQEAGKKGGSPGSGKKKSQSGGRTVSTKTMTLNNAQQKVNDVDGNPVIIGSVVIWRIVNPTKAVFNVENYNEYISIQCDSTIRNIARLFPYDTTESEDDEMTLRGSSLQIAERMKEELQSKVTDAGIEIMEVRITHLAYAEEIAAAMLKRQQAAATIAAREKIVEGAVGMVRMALDQLEEDELIVLDDERKAAMVSNLLVVLCGDREAQPVVNSGSIY
ncbi:MAG TPA: SPFH domain-containing protein [Candidatus Copromorpha excrementigallinarum]|uniref:SPFH domain-containing protein n=1 Tax=Candidatus Allocopromorpha excrementigallinarum TaxID=2840742 RepID=A0A9D1I254_9FIRM|nr:SPFH domain-containing protein [Candidatus Copromorpha excrementigallinarum]